MGLCLSAECNHQNITFYLSDFLALSRPALAHYL